MNRLFAEPAAPARTRRPHAPHTSIGIAKLTRSSEPFSFFAPLHYEANYAYPLVVWLHSAGGDERQLARIMPLVSMRNYVGMSVRGPVAHSQRGFSWPQTGEGIDLAEQRILESVDRACEKYNIHQQRIYLAGYESGGTMAFRVALRHPERFSAAVSIGGAFPEGESPLGKLPQLRKFPLLIAHCRDSQAYPVDRVCQELSLFHAAGLAVTLRQYPCGDELTTQMLHDLDVWLMQQVTGEVPAELPEAAEQRQDWN
jgi:phospholipase/carboxylesterase